MRRRRSASSVADMATRVRSSRRAARASARRARSRSLSKERSWTSSRMTASTPLSSGSRWRRRRRSPAVTTSIRVSGPARRSPRTAYPTVPPTSSPRRSARRRAAARAAMRRGWVTTTRPGRCSGVCCGVRPGAPAGTLVRTSARSGGTSVVLPVPGGAVRTRQVPAPASSEAEAEGLGERRSRSSGSTSTTGRSGGEASSALMGLVCGGCVRPCGPVRVMPRLCPVGEWTGPTPDRGRELSSRWPPVSRGPEVQWVDRDEGRRAAAGGYRMLMRMSRACRASASFSAYSACVLTALRMPRAPPMMADPVEDR